MMTDFEKQVLQDLTELKAQMRQLLGNGQPGRLQLLEQRVQQHEEFVHRASGVGAVFGLLLTIANVLINYFHWKPGVAL
jgi:hypothetical protein